MTTRLLKVDLNGAVWKAKRGAGLSTTLEAVRADVQSSAPSAVWGQLLLDDVLHLGGALEPFLVFFFFHPSKKIQRERGALAFITCAVHSQKGDAGCRCCGFGVRCRVSLRGRAATGAQCWAAGGQRASNSPAAAPIPTPLTQQC